MNKFLIMIILAIGFLFAVKPVSRSKEVIEEPTETIEVPSVEFKVTPKHDNRNLEVKDKSNNRVDKNKDDKFQDVDSNSVNDQRENDLLKIKWLRTRFKGLFKNEWIDKEDEPKKPAKPPKKKTRR